MNPNEKPLDTLVQEKLDADTDFQTSLEELPEEDRGKAIHRKRSEIKEQEFASLSEKATKAEKKANDQEIRAKKAEGKVKNPTEKKTPTTSTETEAPDTSNYSLLDIRALNNVPDEDIERVDKFAKSEGISIPEALKHDDLQAILSNRAEKRKTANATNTGKGGRGSSGSSAEKILSDAQKGKYPEDDEGIKKLVAAEHNEKKRKIKKRD